MLWRNRPEVVLADTMGGSRAAWNAWRPGSIANTMARRCVEQWEETCEYYIPHLPFNTYGRKWRDRKGRAIHTQSDFMRPLYEWGDTLFANAVKI